MRVMVVGAHAADPFDLAGGAMAKYVQAGHEVTVVALSLGARSHTMTAGSIEELRDTKREELHRAADILGVQIHRPEVLETTALGAAYLAALGVGVFSDLAEIGKAWRLDRSYESTMKRGEVEERVAAWRDAVAKA